MATVHIRDSKVEDVMKIGKVNFVDLAGSENISKSGAIDKRAREAGSINQSLLTLARVNQALIEKSSHIPYRESKLTRILQDSLGGKTKTSIIVTVAPTLCNVEETISSLEYANRARNIKNKPEVNRQLTKKDMLQQCNEEISKLRKELMLAHSGEGVYIPQENYDQLINGLQEKKVTVAESLMICRELDARIKEVERRKEMILKNFEECKASLARIKVENEEAISVLSQKEKELEERKMILKAFAERYEGLIDDTKVSKKIL